MLRFNLCSLLLDPLYVFFFDKLTIFMLSIFGSNTFFSKLLILEIHNLLFYHVYI